MFKGFIISIVEFWMSRLFQQASRDWSQNSIEATKCYQEINTLNQQLSTMGMQHLFKLKEMEAQLEDKERQIQRAQGIAAASEAQLKQMEIRVREGEEINRELVGQLSQFNLTLQDREREYMKLHQQMREEKEERDVGDGREEEDENNDLTQDQLMYLHEKTQLLELKNEALTKELLDARDEQHSIRNNQGSDIAKYEVRMQELVETLGKLQLESDSLNGLRHENTLLHKELQLKIHEVEDLRNQLDVMEDNSEREVRMERRERREKRETRENGQNSNKEDNLEEYLEEAIHQINELRKENESLKSSQPADRNSKQLKGELVAVRAEYSNSLKENNFLIEENAKLEKQKNQLFVELERHRNTDHTKQEKAYLAVCEDKDRLEIELANTYSQIQKLNNLLIKKQQEALHHPLQQNPPAHVAHFHQSISLPSQGSNYTHWKEIQSRIDYLRSQNQALKQGSYPLPRTSTYPHR